VRILHWYPNYFAGGAIASAVCGLATAQSLLGSDTAIAAVTVTGSPLYESMENRTHVTIIRWTPTWTLQCKQLQLRGIPKEAVHRLHDFNPDLIHIHGEFNPDNLWVPRLFRRPIVLSPQGVFFPEAMEKYSRRIKALYVRFARQVLYRKVAAFHACSPVEGSYIAKYFPEQLVYPAPMALRNYIEFPKVCQPVPMQDKRTIDFIYVGRLAIHHKGLDILLQAFAHAIKLSTRGNLRLTLVGPDFRGGERWLRNQAEELGVANYVSFTGSLTGDEVIAALEAADIYIQMSRYEGFGLSILEALLAGKPVILSQSSGVSSYAEISSLPHVGVVPASTDEASRTMVQFANNIGDITKQAEQYRRPIWDFFSWQRIARVHLGMYQTLGATNEQKNVSRRSTYKRRINDG
jgi:glycosyltransferase involved in cell wall biosynthesis